MEKWEDIDGYDGSYKISNMGRVMSMPKKSSNPSFKSIRILKPDILQNGYHQVCLFKNGMGKVYKIHRLTAISFIENKNNPPYVNHKDGNKGNNEVSNLEWCTPKQNTGHAIRIGKMSNGVGENNHNSKLTENQVFEIRCLAKEGASSKSIAKLFGVSSSHIDNIAKNRTWVKAQ